ncbi:MAG: hypothetical protein AAF266_06690 [Planctomycetota bacterium]
MSTDSDATPEPTEDCIAVYETADEARTAVKLLVNSGFSAEQLFVLCSDETNAEKFRSRLLPAGAPQLNTAPEVVGGAGAAVGAAILGAFGLATGPGAAVAGAVAGALTGGSVGILLGTATYSDDETNRLMELHRGELDKGNIVVVLRPREEDDRSSNDWAKAKELMATARGSE